MSKPLCAICGEPMAAVVEVRRTNRPWQRYDVYSALAVAEDTKRRVEGDGIEARVIPLYQHTAPQAVPAVCEWTQDTDFESGDAYHSSCGELWSFIDGGPKENRVSYCHHCGKPVKLAAAPKGAL